MILPQEPFGRKFSSLAKSYLEVLTGRMQEIDIERYFYPLVIIAEQKTPLTQQQLADLLGVDKVTVLRIVNYLTEKGYITREKFSADKRAHLLTTTAKAKKQVPFIKKNIEDLNTFMFQGCSKEEIACFRETMVKIKNNMKEMPSVKVRINYKKVKRSSSK